MLKSNRDKHAASAQNVTLPVIVGIFFVTAMSCLALVAYSYTLISQAKGKPDKSPPNNNPPGQEEPTDACPKISQASLNVTTQGCTSTMDVYAAESRTAWTIEKTVDTTGPLQDPDGTLVDYTVKVTEGPTSNILTMSGQLIITNSGEQEPVLSSVVANLQTKEGGEQYNTIASALALKDVQCRDESVLEGAQTCFGSFENTGGASLILTDGQGNDITAYLGTVPIPPSDCSKAVIINYTAEFDMDALGLEPGDNARLELLSTFVGAGGRGDSPENVSCTVDANCNGTLDGDNPSTCKLKESERNNVRTVAHRKSFPIPSYTAVCSQVQKTDPGMSANDSSCVSASSNTLSQTISSMGQGTIDTEYINGTASCINSEACSTDLTNEVTLTCTDGRDEMISGSPAGASIEAICTEATQEISVGDFCTFSQGGYGGTCQSDTTQPSCIRDNNFATSFPSGLFTGDGVTWTGVSPNNGTHGTQNGASNGYGVKWLTAAAIQAFLPAGGPSSVYTMDLTDPASTPAGTFAANLAANTINATFDLNGVFDSEKNQTTNHLADLVFIGDCDANGKTVASELDGMSVRQVMQLAETVISGNTSVLPSGLTISELNETMDSLVQNFHGCTVNFGCLRYP